MLQRVATIAFNTYRESVRARVLYGLFALALGTALYSIAVGAFTLTNAPRVVSDLGAASISLYAVIVSVVLAGTSLYRELEQKTIFPILARPIRRAEYLVGKYLGILLVLGVFIALDAAVVLLIVATIAGRSPVVTVGLVAAAALAIVVAAFRMPRAGSLAPLPVGLALLGASAALAAPSPDELRVVLGSAALSLLEIAILAAVATLFASFSSPFLSSVFTFGVFLVGRSADTLAKLPAFTFGETIHAAARAVSHVVPNLQVYVPPRPLLTGEATAVTLGGHLALAAAQSAAWAVGLLALSSLIFRKRDFL